MNEINEQDWRAICEELRRIAPIVLSGFPRVIAQDIDDIVQDVATTLLDKVGYQSIGPGLLAVMIKHQAIDRLRSKHAKAVSTFPVAELEGRRPEADSRKSELWELLQRGLAQLPTEDVTLLRRFYFEQTRIAELAREHGVQYSTMAVRLHRIKEKLREQLSALQVADDG